MLLNCLRVLPTEPTKEYLRDLFKTSPITLDPDTFYVTVFQTRHNIEPNPTARWFMEGGTIGTFYDSGSGHSSLILPLHGDLDGRFLEIQNAGFEAYWCPQYVGYMKLIENMSPVRRHTRGFIASISDALYGRTLEFGLEHIVSEVQDYMPDSEFIMQVLEGR